MDREMWISTFDEESLSLLYSEKEMEKIKEIRLAYEEKLGVTYNARNHTCTVNKTQFVAC